MKKLLLVLLLATVAVLVARRRAAQHEHGTPDHWPAVPRKIDATAAA